MVADALSRRDAESVPELAAICCPSFTWFEDLRAELAADPAVVALKEEVQAGTRTEPWAIVDDLLTFEGRVYVPPTSPSLSLLLSSAHGAGHEGTQKTLHRLRADFHVPGARAKVADFVRACTTCQRNKSEQLHPAGLLQLLEVPSAVWVDIVMDFVESLPCANGKSVILIVVDRFSKYVHFIPLGHLYSATMVAWAFFADIVRLHGIPSSIVSDRDPVFTSKFWPSYSPWLG